MKGIIKKTIGLGSSIIVSKFLGLIREIFLVRYLGVGIVADAFITAFRIPNSLRKIFAEGALSAALIPTLVRVVKREGKEEASRVTTLTFVIFESIVFVLCLAIAWLAPYVIGWVAPGWFCSVCPPERIALAIILLRILVFFILFISSSALLAGALNAVNHFAIPAAGPIVLNILFIGQLIACLCFKLPVVVLAGLLLVNAALVFVLHVLGYRYVGFSFLRPTDRSWKLLRQVLGKFFPSLVGLGAMEINLFVDQILASYLPVGSIALLSYTSGFLRIPLGGFAVALSTVLLPFFSHIGTDDTQKMSEYVFESLKLVFWVTIPAAVIMSFFSYQIFYTTLFSQKFTVEHVRQASILLTAFLSGLCFFASNKILVNVYYAMHETLLPTIITLACTVLNTLLNVIFMRYWGLLGIVLATSVAAAIKTYIFMVYLRVRMSVTFDWSAFTKFLVRYCVQLSLVSALFYALYRLCVYGVGLLPESFAYFFLWRFGFWLWTLPLMGLFALCVYVTRNLFGVKLHFLE